MICDGKNYIQLKQFTTRRLQVQEITVYYGEHQETLQVHPRLDYTLLGDDSNQV